MTSRNILLSVAGLLLLSAMLPVGGAFGQGAPKGPPPAAPVEVAVARSGTAAQELSAIGTLRANESVTVRAEIDGRIDSIRFTEGRPVRRGEVLLSLDGAEQQAVVAEAQATLALAQANFERARDLVEKKFVSRQAYEDAHARLQEAKARLDLQQVRLAKHSIRAPFDGVMGLRKSSPGDYVKAGDDIVALVDMDSLKLEFQVPETALTQLHDGQTVSIAVDAFPGESFSGRVTAIEPGLDEATRSVRLQARVANPGHRLRPGMFARVGLTVARRENAVLVPEQAIWPVGGERFVFIVVDGRAVRTQVRLGQRQGGEVEILQGVRAGDTVVTAGQARIRDGTPVKPLASDSGIKG